ncbi:hypothetical protein B0F90DRAFT_1764484, partial [Multifurca ochricompacta]
MNILLALTNCVPLVIGIGSVSSNWCGPFSMTGLQHVLFQVFPPAQAVFSAIDVLLSVRISSPLLPTSYLTFIL